MAFSPRAALAQSGPQCTQVRFHTISGDGTRGPQVVDVQCNNTSSPRIPAAATLSAVSGLGLSMGVLFAILADNASADLAARSRMVDPMTGLPLVRYSDVMALDQARQAYTGLAIGGFVLGVGAGIAAVVLWALPWRRTPSRASAAWRPIVGATPTSVSLTLGF